jgi:hypothetical protein
MTKVILKDIEATARRPIDRMSCAEYRISTLERDYIELKNLVQEWLSEIATPVKEEPFFKMSQEDLDMLYSFEKLNNGQLAEVIRKYQMVTDYLKAMRKVKSSLQQGDEYIPAPQCCSKHCRSVHNSMLYGTDEFLPKEGKEDGKS